LLPIPTNSLYKNTKFNDTVKQRFLRPGIILWYELSNGEAARDSVHGISVAGIGQVQLQQKPGN